MRGRYLKRRPNPKNYSHPSPQPGFADYDLQEVYGRSRVSRGRVLRLQTLLPRSVANIARREIYPYPYPRQRQLLRKALKYSLILSDRSRSDPLVPVVVRIRVPTRLPLVRPSGVDINWRRGTLRIASKRQVKHVSANEYNRRRYAEKKGHYRKARHGQLDSPGALRGGLVARAAAQGRSIDQIADQALIARAVLRGRA